jgi:predicted Holliday junction resolvase-like endonuclease
VKRPGRGLGLWGHQIDYLVFSGLAKGNRVAALFFVDVKSGNARLSGVQHSIKKAVESGAVSFGITEK